MRILFPFSILLATTLTLLQSCVEQESQEQSTTVDLYYSIEDFTKVPKTDAHVHINTFDTLLIGLAKEMNFRLISLNVGAPEYPPLPQQQQYSIAHLKNYPDMFAYATSFDMKGFEQKDWHDKTLDYLRKSFDNGAVGVKVWKHIGMELKDRKDNFIMIDHPRFDTVFNYIASKNKTLVGHLGEPKNCWLPIEEMTVENDRNYFKAHPEYHMYLHKEFPSYEQQIDARNNLLQKHPDLKFDGAHLGSLEWSVDALAEHLDRFPAMAVDMAERISHLQYQAKEDHQKVVNFFTKYQDRLIYATDIVEEENTNPAELEKYCRATWTNHWKFFTSDDMMEAPEINGKFKGLHLPKSVVDKIYRLNAEKWFEGIF